MKLGLLVAAASIAAITQEFPPRPEPAQRRFDYENLPPPPNPKADKRKANRVKQMQAKKQRRREMSGRKP